MKTKATCKYYDEEFGICTIDYDDCSIKTCNVYENKYVRKDCKYLCESGKSDYEYECRLLCNEWPAGAPCCKPRLNKNGEPVACTFYKKKEDK